MVRITIQLFGTWQRQPLHHIEKIFETLPLNKFCFKRDEYNLPTSITNLAEPLSEKEWEELLKCYYRANLHYSMNQGILICSEDYDRRVTTWKVNVFENLKRIECDIIDMWHEGSPHEVNRKLTRAQCATHSHCIHDLPKYKNLSWFDAPLKGFSDGTLRFEFK